MKAYEERVTREQQERIVLAWWIAGLSRQHQLPDLGTLLQSVGEKQPQSWQHMRDLIQSMGADAG